MLGMTPHEVFDALAAVVATVVTGHGFHEETDEEHPQAFGSRARTWRSGRELIRMTWDGKDQFFVVEASDEPDVSGRPVWVDVDLRRWEPGFRDDIVTRELRARLIEYFG
jgi:hypothetical protein